MEPELGVGGAWQEDCWVEPAWQEDLRRWSLNRKTGGWSLSRKTCVWGVE